MQNWAGNFTFAAAKLHRPRSIGELQKLVAAAAKIRPVGTGHSFNGIADSPGEMVDLRGIAPDVVVDRERMTATVGAGASYTEVAVPLHNQGYALHNLASLPHISIAGAVATATHGSGDHNETLASAVSGLEIVLHDGSIQHVKKGDADFNGMVVGLGAFGILSRVTLDISPTFDVRQDSFIDLPLDDMVANFDAISSSAYSVSIFTTWSGPTADRIWLKSKTSTSHTPDVAHLNLKPGLPYSVPPTVGDPLARMNAWGVAGPWSERLAHIRHDVPPAPADQIQSEYMIPRNKFAESIAFLRSLASRIAPIVHSSEIRTMAADELWLSPAYQQEQIGLHFTWKKEIDAVNALTREIEATLVPLGAKPHWGKVIHADAATLAPLYPRMADFRSLAMRYDPKGKFRNAFLDRHIFG